MYRVGSGAVTSDQFKVSKAILVCDDCLTVDQAGPHWELADRRCDTRKTADEVVSVSSKQPHCRTIAPGENTKAVVFDFVNPTGTGRRSLSG
jgi:hypothetical protein